MYMAAQSFTKFFYQAKINLELKEYLIAVYSADGLKTVMPLSLQGGYI